MTFILAITSRHSIWLVADRRLSRNGRAVRDDAIKILSLETVDGNALVGYAGLGATAIGTQPSAWMSNVLRGRGTTLDHSMQILSEAMQAQLPRHLRGAAQNGQAKHHVVAPAFVGSHPRLYSVEMAVSATGMPVNFRHTRWTNGKGGDWPPSFGLAGSGVAYLPPHDQWARFVLRLVKAQSHGRIRPEVVADVLSELVHKVHRKDPYTGPNCVVAWRFVKRGEKGGGGGHQFYENNKRVGRGEMLPSVARGRDMRALISELLPGIKLQMEAMLQGKPPPEIDMQATTDALNKLPTDPDDKLK